MILASERGVCVCKDCRDACPGGERMEDDEKRVEIQLMKCKVAGRQVDYVWEGPTSKLDQYHESMMRQTSE